MTARNLQRFQKFALRFPNSTCATCSTCRATFWASFWAPLLRESTRPERRGLIPGVPVRGVQLPPTALRRCEDAPILSPRHRDQTRRLITVTRTSLAPRPDESRVRPIAFDGLAARRGFNAMCRIMQDRRAHGAGGIEFDSHPRQNRRF